MDLWLVRTAQNLIAGPYNRSQVQELVRDGKLTHQDEICSGNGYWIFLHEGDEILKQLGVSVPRLAGGDDEITQSETLLERPERTDPALVAAAETQGSHANFEEQTSMVSAPNFRAATTVQAPGAEVGAAALAPRKQPRLVATATATRSAAPVIERTSVWRLVAWLLLAAALLLIVAVFRVTRQ